MFNVLTADSIISGIIHCLQTFLWVRANPAFFYFCGRITETPNKSVREAKDHSWREGNNSVFQWEPVVPSQADFQFVSEINLS